MFERSQAIKWIRQPQKAKAKMLREMDEAINKNQNAPNWKLHPQGGRLGNAGEGES